MLQYLIDLPMPVVLVLFIISIVVLIYVARRVAVIKTYIGEADKCYWQAKEAADEEAGRAAYAEMLDKYKKAAALGSSEAITRLGHAYREGWGVEPEIKQAFGYYLRAARKGFHEAQYHLSLLYEQGLGVDQNLKEARRWYQRSQNKRFRIGF